MAQFQLYNFQFGKILGNEQVNLFGESDTLMSAEKAFPQKQKILQEILENDYNHRESIRFTHRRHQKEYTHKHLMQPLDDITVLRIANKKKTKRTDKNFQIVDEEDYANCLVIIDNRPGIQRLAIEVKKSVFSSDTYLSEIISHTMNLMLKKYSLHIDLMHLQDPKRFWSLIDDKKNYPMGFYKIKFHLPYLNLERLKKKWDNLTVQMRDIYNGKMDVEMTAQNGGELNFSKENELQKAQINFFTEDLGGNSIELVPNNNKRKSIKVGEGTYKYVWMSDTTFKRLTEDAAGNNLFGSVALDEIKLQMKEGID